MSREELLIDKSLRKIEYTFKWFGLNVESKRRSYAENVRNKIVFLINFLWVNTDWIGCICWFIHGAKKGESLTSLTYSGPCITMASLSNFKSISIFLYEEEINVLITGLKKLEKKENIRPRFSEKDEIIKSKFKFLNMTLKLYTSVNWLAILTFSLMPIAAMAAKYFTTNEIELLLPIPTYFVYPFDESDIRFWPFVYIHQVWSVAATLYEIFGTDFLFYICSTHIRIQFRSLRHYITKIIEKSDLENEEFNAKLAELINWHEDLLRLVELLDTIYSKSTLFHFVISSVSICLLGFNTTALDDKALMVASLGCLLIALLQIFFLCFFGDLLTRSSIEVSDAVYNCKWYLSEASVGRKLNIIQIRAQKPSKLTAYGFADVNLTAFTRILSTAWSYFAVLNTVISARH